MTIATAERYAEMLDAARRGGYAYPAINVTSSQTLNAALQGFADAESDGIIQVSVGGAAYFSGQGVNDRVTGSLAFAAFAHEVAKRYPHITVALHTDHCAKQYLDGWVRPLLDMEADEVAHGREPMFQSHMWDGSTVPLDENLAIAEQLLDKSVAARTILEIEIGAVGGEEDGHSAEINEKLYSTPADGVKVAQRLGLGERGRYMAAFTFGNVHGSYKPGVVKLRPELLGDIQREAAQAVADGRIASAAGAVNFPNGKPFALVFHGFGLSPGRDRRGGAVRRRQDEHRYGHAVRVHPCDRRSCVLELRCRAQGGRRGRREEAVRSALLGPRGRERDGGPRRGGLQAAWFRRQSPEVTSVAAVDATAAVELRSSDMMAED